MFNNKITKLFSILIVLSLLLGVIPAMAEESNTVVYQQIDISSAATGKFWVDPTVGNELKGSFYSGKGWTENGYKADFVAASGGVAYSVKAARYPMRIDTNTSDSIPDLATLSGNRLTSDKSGVSYLLPGKTATASEKEVIALGTNTTISQTLSVETKADKIHFLVAAAFGRDMKFSVTPIYKDNENYVQEKEVFTVVGGNTAEDENEICLIESRETINQTTNDFAANANAGVFGGKLVIHEFSLDVDYPESELSALLFNADETTVVINNTHRIGSLAIVSVTAARDWEDKITETEDLISKAVANPTDIDAIIKAVNAVSEIKTSGLDADSLIVNIAQFKDLFGEGAEFADTLIEGIFENAEISWDTTETYLEKTRNVIDAINSMGIAYEELSSDSRLIIENAYIAMIDLLIASDAEEEIVRERFELLKNTGIESFEKIFKEKVIWTESVETKTASELVSFEIAFSQNVDASLLNKDYITVFASEKEVASELITFEPIYTDGSVSGVKVNIINTFDYPNPFRVELSKAIIGEEGGQWAYSESFEKTIRPVFEVNADSITVGENSIEGKLTVTNSQDETQAYVIMLAAYSETGMMLNYKLISGSSASETTSMTEQIEFNIPAGATEILCYPMESYSSMNMLCKPIKLK